MGYQAEIKELTSFVLMIVIVLYTVTVVANLVKAQSSYLTGSSYKYGDAVESIIVLSVLLASAFAVNRFGESSLSVSFESGRAEGTWVGLARTVIALIVGTGYFMIAVNALWTLFKGQSGHMIGRPFQMSEALVKLGGVILGGVLTVFAAKIAQSLVDGIAGLF
jgi:hypothetical protein